MGQDGNDYARVENRGYELKARIIKMTSGGKLKAALFTGDTLKVIDVKKPTIDSGEVLLRVLKAGICGTDVSIIKGELKVPTPLIMGHEFVGRIVEIKGVNEEIIGKRVVSEINISCGKCHFCRINERRHCSDRKVIGITADGAFAEHVKVPSENIHALPDSISTEEGVFVEPLASCIRSFELAPMRKDSTIAVLGPGRMGLLTIQVARIFGAKKIIAVGTRWDRLELARRCGADVVVNAREENAVERIREETSDIGADIVIETTGSRNGAQIAISIVRPRGAIVLKSMLGQSSMIDLTEAIRNEITLLGSRCC